MQAVHPYRLYTNVPRWLTDSTSGTVTTSGIRLPSRSTPARIMTRIATLTVRGKRNQASERERPSVHSDNCRQKVAFAQTPLLDHIIDAARGLALRRLLLKLLIEPRHGPIDVLREWRPLDISTSPTRYNALSLPCVEPATIPQSRRENNAAR